MLKSWLRTWPERRRHGVRWLYGERRLTPGALLQPGVPKGRLASPQIGLRRQQEAQSIPRTDERRARREGLGHPGEYRADLAGGWSRAGDRTGWWQGRRAIVRQLRHGRLVVGVAAAKVSVEAYWHWVRGSVCSALCVCARPSTQLEAERCEGATLSKDNPNNPAGMEVDRAAFSGRAFAGQATKARSRSLSPCSTGISGGPQWHRDPV